MHIKIRSGQRQFGINYTLPFDLKNYYQYNEGKLL